MAGVYGVSGRYLLVSNLNAYFQTPIPDPRCTKYPIANYTE